MDRVARNSAGSSAHTGPLHIVERLGHERLQGGVFLDRDLVAASPL
jgi:hypothetical protein